MAKNETSQNIERDPKEPVSHLNSGYEDATSDDFTIPPCGIEDADIALFNLFDKDIGFSLAPVRGKTKNVQKKKPTVIFATGERFALAKKLKAPRDKNDKLIIPAISIRRTAITQTDSDINSRGINQHTGILTIKRRLNENDRDYQNLLNKFALKNLTNTPTSSRNSIGEEEYDLDSQNGAYLKSKLGNNVWEIINIPQPKFFTATYEVTFWTTYTQHMNYMIETYMSSFLPQDRMHKLNTPKGYWFMAYTEDSLTSADNFDDFTDDGRRIRYTFNVNVRGYVLASNHPTNKVPIRRWVSAPVVNFEIQEVNDQIVSKSTLDKINNRSDNAFALTDLKEDTAAKQKPTTNEKFVEKKVVTDPITGKKTTKYVTAVQSNTKQGETIYQASDRKTLEEFMKTFKVK